MNVLKWTLAAAGGLAVAAIVAFAALGSGVSQADETQRQQAYNQALADELGITVEELQTARQGALDAVLDAAVASGRLTEERAQEIRENPRKALRQAGRHARHFLGGLLDTAAETIGISKQEVIEGLKNGQSLAQISEANGVSAAELKAALTADVEAKLDAAVASGKMTQERADEISANLPERLERLINHTGGQHPGKQP